MKMNERKLRDVEKVTKQETDGSGREQILMMQWKW